MTGKAKVLLNGAMRSKYLRRLLMSYIALLVILVLASSAVYTVLFSALKQKNDERVNSMFDSVCAIMDERLGEVVSLADELTTNSRIRYYMMKGKSTSPDNVKDLIEITSWLPDYSHNTGLLADYYIYDSANDAVIMSRGATFRLNSQYNYMFKYADYSCEDWRCNILSKFSYHTLYAEADCMKSGVKGSYMLFVTSFYNTPSTAALGQLVMQLNPVVLRDVAAAVTDEFAGFWMLNTQNEVLCLLAGEEFPGMGQLVSDNENTYYYKNSSVLNITYTARRSAVTDEAQFAAARALTYTAIALVTVTGFLFSIIMAWRNGKPVLDIKNSLQGGISKPMQDDDSELAFINSSVNDLLTGSRNMQQQLRRQKAYLEESLYTRLVYSVFYDKNNMEELMENAGVRLKGSVFMGAFVLLNACGGDNADERSLKLVNVRNELMRYDERVQFCLPVDNNRLAVLFVGMDAETLKQQVTNVLETVHDCVQPWNTEPLFYVGCVVNDAADIYTTFAEAERLITNAEPAGSEYIICKRQDAADEYIFDSECAKRVVNLCCAGNKGAVTEILDCVCADTVKRSQTDSYNTSLALYCLSYGVLEVCRQLNYTDLHARAEAVVETRPVSKAFEELQAMYGELCDRVNEKKARRGNELYDKINEYVAQHYCEYDLTLGDIAAEFGMNERYLTGLYKEISGNTLWNYVISLRMNEAQRLLTDTDMPIAEAAEKVGYTNVSSFRRMYKQYIGTLPSQNRRGEGVEQE